MSTMDVRVDALSKEKLKFTCLPRISNTKNNPYVICPANHDLGVRGYRPDRVSHMDCSRSRARRWSGRIGLPGGGAID